MIHDTKDDQRRSWNSGRALHLVDKVVVRSKSLETSKRSYRRVWLGAAALAACTICAIGLVQSKSAKMNQDRPITASPVDELSRQLRSLTQADLIQFQDGRIWYVRSVRADEMEIVGWIGDNTRVENIPSFVVNGERFRIVRHGDQDWPSARDRYFRQ